MPLELIVAEPRRIDYTEYSDRDLRDGEVLVRTLVSGIKHGTELNMYRGTLPFAEEVWDTHLRVFRPPGEGERIAPFYPHTLGSWAAGVVEAVGPNVTRWHAGDRVHGEWKHRQTAIKPETTLYPLPAGTDAETMLFTDPARFALGAIHDAAIKLGDRVAIFGLGAIGMLAAQLARLNGATQVIVVDPIPARLALAQELGADVAVNPAEADAGLAIKQATDGQGVDVAIELSGAYAALQQAVRSVQREGLVVAASYYGAPGQVDFSREWHHNRVTLRSSMPVWGCTHRSHPLWDLARVERTAMALLANQALQVKPLIGARVPFDQAGEAYALIDRPGSDCVKVVLTYPT
jgi:2-desacetyl-2-hydroxyethyl bacteriochlorophyllide A dehydrogenase